MIIRMITFFYANDAIFMEELFSVEKKMNLQNMQSSLSFFEKKYIFMLENIEPAGERTIPP